MGDETISSNGDPGTKEAEAGESGPDTKEAEAGESGPDTKEAEALAAALNHSAVRVQTLWFSFLSFMLYLAIATGTTTHRKLFLEEPLNLPVLNIPLPLLGFYILAPVIFVVFHFYMLLNLVLLARTAKSFEDAVARAFPEDGEARETFRMRIENTLFVQLLVGGRLEREGLNGKLLSWMALITLALAPVALLLMLEIMFLPYHSEWRTWVHRGLLTLDLALVWTLWPGYRSGWGVRLLPKGDWLLVVPGVMSAVALVYAVLVATFPDERMYVVTNWLHGISYRDFIADELKWRDRPVWYGWIGPVNTLDLHGQGLIDFAKLENIKNKNKGETGESRWEPTLLLQKRDLTEANLSDADIRQVEFYDAVLNRARLDRAWAKNAHFERAKLQGASIKEAQLQDAVLNEAQLMSAVLDKAQLQNASFRCARHNEDKGYDCAQLQGASLIGALLQGADLSGAQLQNAKLDDAHLQDASLYKTDLWGASLKGAQLQGASLKKAALLGASLDGAQLQGASLKKAALLGASLKGAYLEGASLDSALLQGASLRGAKLQGASLDGARLQGASLQWAILHSASFINAFVWRADGREADWGSTQVASPELGQKCYESKSRAQSVPLNRL